MGIANKGDKPREKSRNRSRFVNAWKMRAYDSVLERRYFIRCSKKVVENEKPVTALILSFILSSKARRVFQSKLRARLGLCRVRLRFLLSVDEHFDPSHD